MSTHYKFYTRTTLETVDCRRCSFTKSSDYEYEVIESLLRHIKRNHKKDGIRLEKQARILATGENGCGYFDDGKSKSGGWHAAQKTFRHAWRKTALRAWFR